MKNKLTKSLALLQIALVSLTGCHPTQPFYVGGSGDLAHYIDTAQRIEYPDLQSESLPEAGESMAPYSVDNHDYEFLDLTLEECVSYALVNTKLVRALPGSNQIVGDIATSILTSPSQQLVTAFDPAITASTANTQPQVVDQNGNRVLPRGASRANQVGGIEDALSEFDAQFSSFVGYNTTDRPRNVGAGNVFNPQFFQANDGTMQSAISKRVATGGVVTARSQTIYSENNIFTQGFGANGNFGRQTPSDYTQILEAQVQHPLMRGRGTMVNRIPVVLARINEDVSLGQYEERIRNLVKEVEVAYWDLYLSYWNVETAKIARDSSLQVWRVANAKYQAGQGQVFAEAQAKAQYHQFEAALNAALAGASVPGSDPGVYGRERRLRHLMGWAATDGRLIRPTDKPNIARTDFDWWTVQGEALMRNIDLRQQKWQIKAREMELISSKNQVLPDVNVSALYRWLGVGDTLNSRSGSAENFPEGPQSATDSLLTGNFSEAAFRLEFTPAAFGARRQLALVRNSQLALARETEVLQEKEIALINRLSEEISLMKSHYEQIEIKLNQWSASERDAKAWTDKFEVGDTNLDMILDNLLRSQERRARAQQDYYRSVTEYNKSIVQVHLLKGSLLEYNNICLQEGPWAEKAYWDAEGHAKRRDAARYMDYGASRPRVISEGAYQQHTGTANDGARVGTVGLKNNSTPTPSKESSDNAVPPRSDVEATPGPTTKTPNEEAPTGSTEELPSLKANSQTSSRVFRQAGFIHTQPSTPSNMIR
ncbi:MAG: TolC family protein [Planctomycetota bacterium]|nr:TolC family protein [Planctomycetota bacterium]